MKINLWPKTASGKWSIGLGIAFILLISLKMRPAGIPLPTFSIAALGLVGFAFSLMSIIKGKDRAILNFMPLLLGLLIILWMVGEMIYPH